MTERYQPTPEETPSIEDAARDTGEKRKESIKGSSGRRAFLKFGALATAGVAGGLAGKKIEQSSDAEKHEAESLENFKSSIENINAFVKEAHTNINNFLAMLDDREETKKFAQGYFESLRAQIAKKKSEAYLIQTQLDVEAGSAYNQKYPLDEPSKDFRVWEEFFVRFDRIDKRLKAESVIS